MKILDVCHTQLEPIAHLMNSSSVAATTTECRAEFGSVPVFGAYGHLYMPRGFTL